MSSPVANSEELGGINVDDPNRTATEVTVAPSNISVNPSDLVQFLVYKPPLTEPLPVFTFDRNSSILLLKQHIVKLYRNRYQNLEVLAVDFHLSRRSSAEEKQAGSEVSSEQLQNVEVQVDILNENEIISQVFQTSKPSPNLTTNNSDSSSSSSTQPRNLIILNLLGKHVIINDSEQHIESSDDEDSKSSHKTPTTTSLSPTASNTATSPEVKAGGMNLRSSRRNSVTLRAGPQLQGMDQVVRRVENTSKIPQNILKNFPETCVSSIVTLFPPPLFVVVK